MEERRHSEPVRDGEIEEIPCPTCGKAICVTVSFMTTSCGYYLTPSCPNNCDWSDPVYLGVLRKVNQLLEEKPEIFSIISRAGEGPGNPQK